MDDSNGMKRRLQSLCFFGLLLLAAPGLFSQAGGTITVQNSSDVLMYVTTLPVTIQEFRELQTNPAKAATLAEELFPQMETILPGSYLPNLPSFTGETLILALQAESASAGYPISVKLIPGGSAGRAYALGQPVDQSDTSPDSIGMLPVTRIKPHPEPIRIDGRFVDWLSRPELRSYRQDSMPVVIIQQNNTGIRQITPGDSVFWRKGGAQLDVVKTLLTQENLYFMASSYQQITPGTSIILRLHKTAPKEQQSKTADVTIEIPVVRRGGPVYLWPGSALGTEAGLPQASSGPGAGASPSAAGPGNPDNPIYMGQYGASNFSVEAAISRAILEDFGFFNPEAQDGVIELSTGVSDAGIFEEFYYGLIPLAEVIQGGR